MGRQSLGRGNDRLTAAGGRQQAAGGNSGWLPWRRPRAAQRTLATAPSLSLSGGANSEAYQTSRQPPSAGSAALRHATDRVHAWYGCESAMSGSGQRLERL